MRHAATVFSKAAAELIEKGKVITAAVLATPADGIAFADGRFVSRDTNRNFDLFELAAEAARTNLAGDLASGLSVVTDNEMHDPVFPNGCAICEVEVDPDRQ
jgi:carbon-monoxide dehydrogenase large subunit